MNRLIIIGSGGHASVLVDILREQAIIVGYADRVPATSFFGIPYIGNDEDVISMYPPSSIKLVNGLGSIESLDKRHEIFRYFKSRGYTFESVIHPSSMISKEATLEEGVQLLAGTIVQCNSFIGANSVVNSGSIVEHDSFIGKSVHLSPRVVVGGGCSIGDFCHVGIGSTVIQGIRIGRRSLVGAGSVVIHHLEEKSKVMGVPAKRRGNSCNGKR